MYYIPPELVLQLAKIRMAEYQAAAEASRLAARPKQPRVSQLADRLVRSALRRLAMWASPADRQYAPDDNEASEQLAA